MKSYQKFVFVLLFLPVFGFAASVHHGVHGYPEYPKVDYGVGKQAEKIKRGEYLVKMGDCIACHTSDDAKQPFAGGLAFKTPFGTLYSPNLTPDKETGIGKWTEADFVKAMHDGISPDGSYYFPVFPYTDFNKVPTKDIKAIWAYIKALPAIKKQNKENEMPFPFRVRFFQLGWRILFFHKGKIKPNPYKSDDYNRGQYIVKGLGHCGMCHTPLNFLGGQKNKYYLKGGFVDGFHAPNISGSRFKDVPVERIVKVFKQNHLVEGGRVIGPMAAVNHDSLMNLTDPDLKAIAVFLKQVKSTPLPVHKHPTKIGAGTGKKVYNNYCAACHTSGAGGAPMIGDVTEWKPRIKHGLPMLVKHAIKGFQAMPPKGGCTTCSNDEIQAAVEYIFNKTEHPVHPSSGEVVQKVTLPTTSLAEGKKIYEQYCALCHKDGHLGAPMLGDKLAWTPRVKQGMDVLIRHVVQGYNKMPVKGACQDCTTAQIIAAIKYMLHQTRTAGDYSLW